MLLAVDPGFRTENVITGAISLPAARFASDDAARAFLNRSLASIRQLPGVAAAGATTIVPLGGAPRPASSWPRDTSPSQASQS